jgi:hypothetical protein
LTAVEKRKKDMEIKPKLNITLKLEVANKPMKDRAFV